MKSNKKKRSKLLFRVFLTPPELSFVYFSTEFFYYELPAVASVSIPFQTSHDFAPVQRKSNAKRAISFDTFDSPNDCGLAPSKRTKVSFVKTSLHESLLRSLASLRLHKSLC